MKKLIVQSRINVEDHMLRNLMDSMTTEEKIEHYNGRLQLLDMEYLEHQKTIRKLKKMQLAESQESS